VGDPPPLDFDPRSPAISLPDGGGADPHAAFHPSALAFVPALHASGSPRPTPAREQQMAEVSNLALEVRAIDPEYRRIEAPIATYPA
jgi:hypothetical protein